MKFTFSLLLFLFTLVLSAQTPAAFNYQGAARDANNEPLSVAEISLRISILEEGINGNTVFVETHSVTTTELGLFAIQVGKGTNVSGAIGTIEWGDNDHYLQVEMDTEGGTDYQLIGTIQFLSVPYAEYAKEAGSGSKWTDSEETQSAINYDEAVIIGEDKGTSGLLLVNNNRASIGPANNTLLSSFQRNYNESNVSFNIFGYPDTDLVYSHLRNSIMLYSSSDARDFVICAAPVNGAIRFVTDDWANPSGERMRITAEGVGIGTDDPKERLHVSNGDVYIQDINKGVIMKSPNGNCWRYAPDDNGQLIGTQISCPN